MKRTNVLQALIDVYKFESYLEIGTQRKEQNFNKLNCSKKWSIDADQQSDADEVIKSDDFFKKNKEKYDLIFIDGDHSHEQSEKDFQNALNHLTEKGLIVMHDAMPHNLEYTKPEWCGEVYKTVLKISTKYDTMVSSFDHGVAVIRPNKSGHGTEVILNYDFLTKAKGLLNVFHTIDEMMILLTMGDSEEPNIEDNDLDIISMSDDDLKELYKKEFGSLPRGKFNREKAIEKLLETDEA